MDRGDCLKKVIDTTWASMKISYISYGKKKVKIVYSILKDNYGLYDPNTHILQLDKRLKGLKLFNTLMHEMFHIIIGMNGINVNERGEEPIAQAVGTGYEKIFKSNPKLRKLLNNCFVKRKG